MREFLILVLKVKSHSYFSLFCGLHLTVIADDFKGLFFLPTFGLEWKREPQFPTRDTRVFHLYPIFRYVDPLHPQFS